MNYLKHILNRRKEAAAEYLAHVKEFIKSKYAHQSTIECLFDLYYLDLKSKKPRVRHSKHDKCVIELTKSEYTYLMVVLLTFPDITFQDLAVYVPRRVYDHLLLLLRFPRFSQACNLSIDTKRSQPIAVDMTTLQDDAREIAGEDMYTFLLPPPIDDCLQDVSAHCECRNVEFKVMRFEYNEERLAVYSFGRIDATQMETALGVSDFRGIKEALLKIYDTLSHEEQSDVFWPIHWLDKNGIHYIRREEFSN